MGVERLREDRCRDVEAMGASEKGLRAGVGVNCGKGPCVVWK